MKKQIISALFAAAVMTGVYAGDSAVFVDGGFSSDGNVYVFGQYGKTDKNFQGWAELFAVDVEKNDYIDGEYYIIKPSAVTKNKKGKDLYGELVGKSYFDYKKYNLKNAAPDKVLYIRESEQKTGTDEIVFKDFVSSVSNDQGYYHVKLVPTVNGSGTNFKSSFYIDVVKQDADGKVLATQKIGNPSIKRKNVKNYKIERIVSSADGQSMVFVIEKTCVDSTGVNIRFMIEAAKLNKDFFTNLAPEEYVEPVKDIEVEVEVPGDDSDSETPAETENDEYTPIVLSEKPFDSESIGDAK